MKTVALLLIVLVSTLVMGQQTEIPDSNFEQALIDLGYDSGVIDGFVPTSNISNIISLNVTAKNISDLKGIQDFAALEYLYCSDNKLKSLNLTKNKHLKILRCYSNSLENLNLSQNPNLITLSCNNNFITQLDVSKNKGLEVLNFSKNKIRNINLSKNISLETLACSENKLASLSINKNPSLTYLNCSFNQLMSLNLQSGGNANITFFDAKNNALKCIAVDNSTYSTANWTRVDAGTTFEENCR